MRTPLSQGGTAQENLTPVEGNTQQCKKYSEHTVRGRMEETGGAPGSRELDFRDGLMLLQELILRLECFGTIFCTQSRVARLDA